MSLKDKIYSYAIQELGLDDCRFTSPEIGDDIKLYQQWLKAGYNGQMDYLKRHLAFKKNPDLLLKGVKSAIIVIKRYTNTNEKHLPQQWKVARYAVGKDYHTCLGERLRKLEQFIRTNVPGSECYSGVDSRPLAERSLALKAGIGFLGKNSMVIHPKWGSYFFIGVVLTNLEIETDQPIRKNCGQCRRCIDACPTKAIKPKSFIDAKRCIGYKTIERKTALSPSELKENNGWLFGCDICQEVCPYNKINGELTDWSEFLPESGVGFDFFDRNSGSSLAIPKTSAMYRSRKTVSQNWQHSLKAR